ncbi:hypothetical protein OZN62_03505 [Aurantiacibacter sp. MUD11]|uniref:hypothetical protein n=1 Tax=Aurantiacibacter sp. MUD11 TaxID=3003265 RepID=UPI0022AA5CFA|nr:hypothetical protein [Aurantiacibacter sp. MUD11]WAT18658.1 hypothetical protein OZN62_03505 [Aurantiacibacter sp. MUD11]
MALAIAISLFFGLVAALALVSCFGSLRYGVLRFREVRAELAELDRAPEAKVIRLRRPQEAFALLAA